MSTEKSVIKLEADRKSLAPEARARLDEIVAQRDVERLRNWGRVLDVVGEIVRTQGHVVRTERQIDLIESQKELIDKEIQKIQTAAAAQGKDTQQKRETVAEVHQQMSETIRDDIPLLLKSFPEFDKDQKAQIVVTILQRIPQVKVEL